MATTVSTGELVLSNVLRVIVFVLIAILIAVPACILLDLIGVLG